MELIRYAGGSETHLKKVIQKHILCYGIIIPVIYIYFILQEQSADIYIYIYILIGQNLYRYKLHMRIDILYIYGMNHVKC